MHCLVCLCDLFYAHVAVGFFQQSIQCAISVCVTFGSVPTWQVLGVCDVTTVSVFMAVASVKNRCLLSVRMRTAVVLSLVVGICLLLCCRQRLLWTVLAVTSGCS